MVAVVLMTVVSSPSLLSVGKLLILDVGGFCRGSSFILFLPLLASVPISGPHRTNYTEPLFPDKKGLLFGRSFSGRVYFASILRDTRCAHSSLGLKSLKIISLICPRLSHPSEDCPLCQGEGFRFNSLRSITTGISSHSF